MVLPLRDKTMASVVIGLDRALRRMGGAPTYALTDNERTVSVDHVCGIAVRNPQIVGVARHYGVTIATCVPADPQSKGGSEATVRIAKADLVPTDHNLRADYRDFAELELACDAFCDRVNTREHRVTRRPPAVMLAEERQRLHPLPAVPHTVCFGQTRKVGWQLDDLRRRCALLGPVRADRRAGLGARRRAAARHRSRRRPAGRARGRAP